MFNQEVLYHSFIDQQMLTV